VMDHGLLDDEVIELLPRLGEASEEMIRAVAGGQPAVLTHHGRPAVVVLDLDSYREAELAAEEAPAS
jgi:prevent-host-death family protein